MDELSAIKESFCYLFVGHWLKGNLGQDRKDTGMMVKVFCETFKNMKKQPALIMKTSSASFSVIDREDMLNKIKMTKLASYDIYIYYKLLNVRPCKEAN